MIRLKVFGACGRMGTRTCALAGVDSRFESVLRVRRQHDHGRGMSRDQALAAPCDVVIDFSTDAGASEAAANAKAHRAALLVGTTGLSSQTLKNIGLAATCAPVIVAPNTSVGVALCNHVIAEIARRISRDFDVDIIEKHHARKRDAPSGTALRFAETLRRCAGLELPDDRVHSVRAGDIVGEHAVEFVGRGERIKIEHSVTNRDVFALGALDAVVWLRDQAPGEYTIEQSLGL